jgi:drug/metabolite transporter (DMT)-like permease
MYSLFAIMMFNVGYTGLLYASVILQKHGAIQAPKLGQNKNTTALAGLVKNKFWTLGIVLNIISIPVYMVILSVSTLSFTLIVTRAGIVAVFIYALRVLKEKLTRFEILGLVLLYAGFIIGIFGVQANSTGLFRNNAGTLGIFVMIYVFIAFCMLIFNKTKNGKAKEVILTLGASISGVGGTVALKIIPAVLGKDLHEPGYIFNLFNFPELGRILIGVFTPHTGYFMGSIYFYIYISCFAFNFLLLTMMFQYGRAAVTIPVNNTINFLGGILFGAFAFVEEIGVFSWIGILLMVVGIILASRVETTLVEAEKKAKETRELE